MDVRFGSTRTGKSSWFCSAFSCHLSVYVLKHSVAAESRSRIPQLKREFWPSLDLFLCNKNRPVNNSLLYFLFSKSGMLQEYFSTIPDSHLGYHINWHDVYSHRRQKIAFLLYLYDLNRTQDTGSKPRVQCNETTTLPRG